MKRTTITLPDDVAAAVQREAKRRDSSVSEVARRAIVAFLDLGNENPRRLPFESLGKSGHRNTARDVDKILAKEWPNAIAGDR